MLNHKNPENKLTLKPHRKAMIKIGTMAIEIEIHGDRLIDGKRSRVKANAAKKAASIIATNDNFFIIKSPLFSKT